MDDEEARILAENLLDRMQKYYDDDTDIEIKSDTHAALLYIRLSLGDEEKFRDFMDVLMDITEDLAKELENMV